ncbi:hypothetical protein OOT00_13375 [Desulfobotulus sp. H1]|uniref:Uncharacterized protein n=1 Tax=Desulfobotulus pelophilus TaxID=2823377 RepID=A0ABT3NBX8_9BACT|nr:hypothetical protein [Desulfobotulus pelophilus]MCW7754977.1 hypothetical protein [Desulfobotulus pelophilus]
MAIYQYGIAGVTDSLHPEDSSYTHLLPSNRELTGASDSVGCGLFLEGVGRFVENHIIDLEKVCGEKISNVRVTLEKHGAFYHPCRVTLNNQCALSFVVNGAVTEEGIRVMHSEEKSLRLLWDKKINNIPELLFSEEGLLSDGHRVSFFSATWFDDFYEFHWSFDGKELAISVWEDNDKKKSLSSGQVFDLFRKAARILSSAYDFDHFHQIFPWHHAAGDFVVRSVGDYVDVRLITVRQYTSLFGTDPEHADMSDRMDCMFYFLWNLLLRMRLDRLDGIGELIWAPEEIVVPCIRGFFDAFVEKAVHREDISMVLGVFQQIIESMGKDGLFEIHEDILSVYHPESPERILMGENLRAHSDLVFDSIMSEPVIK